jgi:uncharacterized membrane protein YhiD involved in acid resistance
MNGFLVSMPTVSVGYFAARAAIALLLGAVVGLERQWRQRLAGLRTNALVALGAALFELFAVLLAGAGGVDPTRIAAYVVSGIGFLGAGVILREGVTVRGINTAATIWCSAAVGVLAGAGYIPAAVIAAALVLLAHVALRPIARRLDRRPASTETEVETAYHFRAICRAADGAHIRAPPSRQRSAASASSPASAPSPGTSASPRPWSPLRNNLLRGAGRTAGSRREARARPSRRARPRPAPPLR